LGFMQIPTLIEAVLEGITQSEADTLENVFAADAQGRALATEWITKYGHCA